MYHRQLGDEECGAQDVLFLQLPEPRLGPKEGCWMERGSTGLARGGQVGGEPPVISLTTLRVKMVLVGSSGVGKSSLTLRFSKNEF
ncbi:hypothetical protein CRUP_010180, partial [Coryphaenoides rupestris]